MYRLLLRRSVEKTFRKLAKRDPQQLRAIQSKLHQVLADPYRYKNLRAPLKHLRRVHIERFVLVYSIDEEQKAVVVEDYDHHDRIYKGQSLGNPRDRAPLWGGRAILASPPQRDGPCGTSRQGALQSWSAARRDRGIY